MVTGNHKLRGVKAKLLSSSSKMCWITELSVLLTFPTSDRLDRRLDALLQAFQTRGSSAVAVGQKPVATCHFGPKIDTPES